MKQSEKIELIIYLLEQFKKDNDWFQAQFKDAENEENNIRHEFEGIGSEDGKPPKYKRRAVLSTRLQRSLISRRVAKDDISILKFIVDYLETESCKSSLNQLKQILGKTRKVEDEMSTRRYIKREVSSAPQNPTMQKNLDKMIRSWKSKTGNIPKRRQ